MKKVLSRVTAVIVAMFILAGCGGGGGGGNNQGGGTQGKNSIVYSVRNSAPAENCPNGGITVYAGIDTNGNAVLDTAEITNTQYVCNGTNGTNGTDGTNELNALISLVTEPSGTNCQYGGKEINAGVDTNKNDVLDPTEITSTSYVCNGATGTNGTSGTDGYNSLVSIVSEPSGTNSTSGGKKITYGMDANRNNILDEGEVTSTEYVCSSVDGGITLAPNGVVGVVRDRSGAPVTAGTVYFVPAGDVAALPPTSIEVTSTNDEPLEDLIAANAATYSKASIGLDGTYRLENLTNGSYFVTFMPDAKDPGHLPGGSECRVAKTAAELIGTRLDLQVSSAPPVDARYVGSGRCIQCHGITQIAGTMHRLGIWSPYESGLLQDRSARRSELNAALDDKFTMDGTTIYFYDYDASRGRHKYRTSEIDPASLVSFTITVRKGSGVYEMLLHNEANPSDPDRIYTVSAVYGGGLRKQQYLTKILQPGGGFFSAILPVRYQYSGSESYSDLTAKVWRDFDADKWYNESSKTFVSPSPSISFEKNCISCHATGVQVDDVYGWSASLISDVLYGDFDYNGDGIKDEVNIGCETCHGPGSAHWAVAGRGKAIVSPSLLTPERETMICGRCHSRPRGAFFSESPVNAVGEMMKAGMSRAEFLAQYAAYQLDGAAGDFYGDPDRHSKSNHQQYSDFIRSKKYKNSTRLMTCSNCHDPHGRANNRQLRAEPFALEEKLCGPCHQSQTGSKTGHVDSTLGPGLGSFMSDASCSDCHMPKTVKSGAGEPGIVIDAVQYWQGDISSHLFTAPDKALSRKTAPGYDMPTGYTKTCATGCHMGP